MGESASAAASRKWILIALMLTMMLAAMDTTIVSTAIPQIVLDLGGFTKFSWVFSIYLLAQTVTIPIYGKLADLYGRKKVLIAGTLIFLIGSAACASSWNMLSLIIFRGLQGLGAGSIMATVNTLAGDLYSVEERGRIQGWLSSIWGLSAIVGPAIGGAFAEYLSWRWIFFINLPIGVVALSLIGRYLHEEFEHKKPKIDYAGSTAILLTMTLLIVGLLEGGQSWPWLSLPSLILFLAVVAGAFITMRIEKKATEPVLPTWLWQNRVLRGSSLSMVGMGLVMMGPEAYLPTFAQASLGLGAIASGFVLASMSLGWPTASALSARLYLRVGFKNAALAGAVLVVLACAGFLLLPRPQPVALVVLDQVLLGAGFGLLSTPMLVGVQSMVAWNKRGVVTSANMFGRYLGQSLGAAVFGAIFNSSFARQMAEAPIPIASKNINVLELLHEPEVAQKTKSFVAQAINQSTHNIYVGLLVFAIATLLIVAGTPQFGSGKSKQSNFSS